LWSIAKLREQQWADAAKGFGWLDQGRSRLGLTALAPFSLVSLARAQVALGQAAEARQTYRRFLALWKDADPDVPMLVQAREEFAKLGS
jgi:TolA-binding protein